MDYFHLTPIAEALPIVYDQDDIGESANDHRRVEMKTLAVMLRVYGEEQDGQWSLICLDFNLAAQAESLDEAQRQLQDQIKGYLRDALEGGADSEHAEYFLTRRAPWSFWMKYYLAKSYDRILGRKPHRAGVAHRRLADRTPIPVQVVAA